MAAYMIREGNAMDGIDDWQERNHMPWQVRELTLQGSSHAFAEMTERERHEFFREWVARTFKGGSVCYGVTSVSSYAKNMTDVERGYNRDGDELSQFNLGMFCDEAAKMPLYYSKYNGSLTDKTNLPYALASAEAFGIRNVKAVVDGGFWDETCIKDLGRCFKSFTIGMPASLKESESLLAAYGQGIETYDNELSYRHIYCVPVNDEICGVPGRVLIYYNALSHISLCDDMYDHITRLDFELSALKRYPKSNLDRYKPYFKITKHARDSGFDYQIDRQKVELLRKNKGFFFLFTTDMLSSPSDILYYYRAKDADEKLFSQIKSAIDCRRVRTHDEFTTDGKVFVTFVACAIRSYILNKLSKLIADDSTSLKKIFNQLSNITIISNGQFCRFSKALTKKQKQILSFFGSPDLILHSF